MSEQRPRAESTWRRMTRPEMLVALSAVLLSLCALFVSLYETALIRKQQHAAVWPHLVLAYTVKADRFALSAMNLGIGPARIRDVAVTLDGAAVGDWPEALARLGGEDPPLRYLVSHFNQMVVPAGEPYQILWSDLADWPEPGRAEAAATIGLLAESVSRIGMSVCYCSVYDDCWRVRLGEPRAESVPPSRCSFGASASFRM